MKKSSVHTILLIEEDPNLRLMAKMMLEEKQYEVTVAENSDVGLSRFSEGRYDLVILDFTLPDKRARILIETFKATIQQSKQACLLFVMNSDIDARGPGPFVEMGADNAFSPTSDWFLEMDKLISEARKPAKKKA